MNALRNVLSTIFPVFQTPSGSYIDVLYEGLGSEGLRFKLDSVNGTDFVARQMAASEFERPMPDVFCKLVRQHPGLFLDIGANNGIYSILACLTHIRVRVMAFEPFPPVLKVLRRNIAANKLRRRIAVQECALSDKAGAAPLHIPDVNHGLLDTSCSLQPDFQPSSRTVSVAVKRLDDIALPASPKIMKIDIEGHEFACLEGAEKTISTHRPFIFCEVLQPANFDRLQQFCERHNYADIRLRPDMAILSNRVQFDPRAWNHLFVPHERMSELESSVLSGLLRLSRE